MPMLIDSPPARARRRSPRRAAPANNAAYDLSATLSREGYLGPGRVLEVRPAKRLVRVTWEARGAPEGAWAQLAIPGASSLQPGDTALVAARGAATYVIGILATAGAPPSLTTSSGATVAATGSGAHEVVQVRSKKGQLVAEYHPGSGKTVVSVDGDLEFVSAKGGISLRAAKAITLVADRLDTSARTLVSASENTYETVGQLKQVQAGRTRTLVKGSCLLQARDAFLRTEEDFKVDGRQIHLG